MISQTFVLNQSSQCVGSSTLTTLDSWADTHQINLSSIIDFALHHTATKDASDFDPESAKTTLTSDDVKKLTRDALRTNLPQLSDEIETSFETVEIKTDIQTSRLTPPYFQPERMMGQSSA